MKKKNGEATERRGFIVKSGEILHDRGCHFSITLLFNFVGKVKFPLSCFNSNVF